MNILVTGGAGYIGSHCVRLLKNKGENVVVLDNLCKGHLEAIPQTTFVEGDIDDSKLLLDTFATNKIDSVIHFAAFSNVGESVKYPDLYYHENIDKMQILIETAGKYGIKHVIFSSSAAIFGEPEYIPIDEEHQKKPVNPYGQNKLDGEKILKAAEERYGLKYCALRYFNAAGASKDGTIGESHEPEYHLLPLIFKTALGQRDKLYVFGDDYDTKDGTCVRDYVHVDDLAEAHYKALQYLVKNNRSQQFNLGSAEGYSVLEVIKCFERISGEKLNYELAPRRLGDPARLVASSQKARELLGWSAEKSSLETIITDAWNWEKNKKF